MAIALLQKDFLRTNSKSKAKGLDNSVFGKKVGVFASLFGCWHEDITRPFMEGKSAYRACLKCGARKPFNPETLETDSRFYYPPIVKDIVIK